MNLQKKYLLVFIINLFLCNSKEKDLRATYYYNEKQSKCNN